jgi:fructose-bisphosphate aldolase class 1
MDQSEMMRNMRGGNAFIAALDQSGGSTPKALSAATQIASISS